MDKRILYLIGGIIAIVLFLQTIYRWIYYTLPWGVNEHPSSGYISTMKFFEPTNLSIVASVIFIAGILLILIFDSKE
jgi:hypothetical protein